VVGSNAARGNKKMKIKFMLDHTDSPIWSNDPTTKSKFEYNTADLTGLGLQPNTIVRIHLTTDLYQLSLNPIYQGFPVLWSGRMHVVFQMLVKHVYEQIKDQLSDVFEVNNGELAMMKAQIDVEKTDLELLEFLDDPSKFCNQNGIHHVSKEALKAEVAEAYKE